MANLGKYIKDHQDEFDTGEPDPGHFRRFEARLAGNAGHSSDIVNRPVLLKIAAVILLLITISVFVFEFATREMRERFSSAGRETELPAEIREAVQYYDNQTSTQIAMLNKLATDHEAGSGVSEAALKEVRSLDAATEDLKKSLLKNPGNERIMDAIIRNQQMKEAMLNTIITRLSQAGQ